MRINTKLVMTVSSILMGFIGLIFSFLPEEVSSAIDVDLSVAIVFQVMGALYFGFAMLNWTAKANLIGGIYGRPVAIGNFSHFAVAAIALVKFISRGEVAAYVWITAIIYSIFALIFASILFTHPKGNTNDK